MKPNDHCSTSSTELQHCTSHKCTRQKLSTITLSHCVRSQLCDNLQGNYFDYTGEMTKTGYIEVYTRIAKVPFANTSVHCFDTPRMSA